MYMRFVLTFLLQKLLLADLSYLDGYSNSWYQNTIGSGQQRNLTITFSSTFTRVPKVIIIPLIREHDTSSTSIGYEISVVSISTSNFIVNAYASVGAIQNQPFKWVAFDDQRVEVLSQFNVLPQSTLLPHNNVNVNKGIILLTSFAGSSLIDFTLSLGTINATTVQVNIVSSNLNKIGYIVILGPDEFLTIDNQINQPPKDTQDSTAFVQNFTNDNNKNFAFTVNRSFRLQLLAKFYTDKCSYQLSSWYQSHVSFSKCAHQHTLINFNLNTMKPFIFKKTMITLYSFYQQSNNIQFKIDELSKTYQLPIANDYVLVPSTYSQITFTFTINCVQNQLINGKFYQCSSCSYKQIKNYCFQKESILRIKSIFLQQIVANEQLYVTMTSNQIQVYQTVVNQISESILILQFNIN